MEESAALLEIFCSVKIKGGLKTTTLEQQNKSGRLVLAQLQI